MDQAVVGGVGQRGGRAEPAHPSGSRSQDDDVVKALSQDELARLVDAIDPRWQLLIELLAATGLRINEARALRRRDIALGSTPSVRVVRAVKRAEREDGAAEVQNRAPHRAAAHVAGEVAAPAPRRSRNGSASAPLRHTCATLLFAQGRDIRQVSAWLGHADASFTLRTYVGLLDGDVGTALSLDAVLGREPMTEAAVA